MGRKGLIPRLSLVAALVWILPAPAPASGVVDGAEEAPTGLARLERTSGPADIVRGIATFNAVPSAADVASLRAKGLTVQPMKRLPLALVRGPASAMWEAVSSGIATDVYPDEAIELLDMASSDAMGAAIPRAEGLTGKGVTVGIVDSGCDASHPDLADHVEHNVKLVSGEYVNLAPDSSNTLVIPFEMGPYQNSDIGSGHGTHVAGIIAADGHTLTRNIGVAPDAGLVCIAIGEVLFTTAVVTAYDFLLDQPDLWGVDVINNSWGNSFQQFDPRHPVHVATRAVSDLGVTVVFAAGNSGSSSAEMGLNPFSEAPWVTSVAANTVQHSRAAFSSNGLRYDNAQPRTIGAGGHTIFRGHKVGTYHPDVTAPGVAISSSCDPVGVAVGPCPPGSNTTAQGTSMASPHVAGAAAVLLHANPALTPDLVRMALQSTAKPVTTAPMTDTMAGFWQAGYGRVDLAAAVDLVQEVKYAVKIGKSQKAADKRVLASTGFAVERSDFWTYDAPRIAAGGSDSRQFTANVPSTITHLKVTLSHPSLAVLNRNSMVYTVTVRDGDGKMIGTTTEAVSGAGTSSVFIDLAKVGATPGDFEFAVSGQSAVSDPDTLDSESLLGRVVVLQVAQLTPLAA